MAKKPAKKRSWRRLVVWSVGGLGGCCGILLLLDAFGFLLTTEEIDATRTAEAGTVVAFAQATNSIETATEAAILAPTETAFASITPTLTNTPTVTLTATSTNAPPTNTPWPTMTPRSTTLYVQSGTVYARECPEANDSTCPVLETLAAGTDVSGVVLVDGMVISGSDQWWQVKYRGREMYIHSSLLSTTRPVIQPQTSGGNTSPSGNTSIGGNVGAPAPQGRPGNCATAVAMGLDAVQAAQWDHLDRDNDGVACYGD